jgi:hypothetical protein
MKMTVFRVVAPCSLVEIELHFIGIYCLYHQHPVDETGSISETSVNFYETTWHSIPEDSHLV